MSKQSDILIDIFNKSIPVIETDFKDAKYDDILTLIVADIKTVEGSNQQDVTDALESVLDSKLGEGFFARLALHALVNTLVADAFAYLAKNNYLVGDIDKGTAIVGSIANTVGQIETPIPDTKD